MQFHSAKNYCSSIYSRCNGRKAKDPQPPLHGMFGKTYIGRFANIKDPLEEESEQKETENIVEEDNDETLDDEEFGLRDIVD